MVRLRAAFSLLVGLLLAGMTQARSASEGWPLAREDPSLALRACVNLPREATPHLDRHGDPLPAGARQRLGRVERLRQGGAVHCLAVAPEGTTFASAGSLG